ncbi:MAG: hypothetical protein KBA53_00540 [Thermoclostridium sp.]|nr:hypothetical protein [Thermoclostridium sp.]
MLAINFANDKFKPASLPEMCMPRRDLLKLYDRISETRLAVVCAPPGYGKTVSCLLWVKSMGRKSVWIGLDEYDNSPLVFYRLFCTGILSTQPDNLKMAEILNSKAFQFAPVEYTIHFLSRWTQDDQSYTFILDDFHAITNKEILRSLPFILKRLPHSFDILLLSRGALPEELNDLIESRNPVMITEKELAFSMEEIQKYYSALGTDITEVQAQNILNTTGGWAIGISALSKGGDSEPAQGGGHILENYIDKKIWAKWNEELREFMLVTAVADEMDAELCAILTGKKNANMILDGLVTQNSFVTKSSGGTYQYHRLLLKFLRDKQKEHPDINVRLLNMKVARWYQGRGDFFTALVYYVKAENHDGINWCMDELNSMYQDISVEEWLNNDTVFIFEKLSDDFIKENIRLVMEYVWVNFINGNADTSLKYMDMLNDYLNYAHNQNTLINNSIIGTAAIIRFADFRRSLHEYAQAFSEQVRTMSKEKRDAIRMHTNTITQNFPMVHRSICDCLEIIPDMGKRLQAIREAFGPFLGKEVDLFCDCVKAGLYYEQNELEKAHETITLVQCSIRKDTRLEIQFGVFMILSQILYAMGKKKESESAKLHFFERIKQENALYLRANFSAVSTKHRLWDADKEAAKIWLEQYFVTDDPSLRFYKLYQYFTAVRAYIVLSKPDEALEYIEQLKKLSADYHRPLDAAEAAVLQGALEWATGAKKEAERTIEGVLQAMQPYHAIRIIADEGAAVLPILKKISAKTERADYQGTLDSHYVKQVFLCAYQVSKRHRGITAHLADKPVKLSRQQKHILTLLAQGYKNAEVVSMTGLTINTVKAHTKQVYLKLNVNRAADAVLEAKRLGLIE